jgi:small subunit ribosomal protein S3
MEKLKGDLDRLVPARELDISVLEVEKPEIDAMLIAQSVAEQLLKRAAFRRVCKNAIDTAMNAGALGARVQVAGRLGGAEIARTEHFGKGKLPLQTLRAIIDFGIAEALTNYGKIGVKAWVYKGLVAIREPEVPLTESASLASGGEI